MKKTVYKIVVSVLLLLSVFLLGCDGCQDEDESFDYKTSDLSSYVRVPAYAYDGAAINITIDSVSEEDVDNAVLQLLARNKSQTSLNEAEKKVQEEHFDRKLSPGDVLSIYYHGYYEENGATVDFAGGNNMMASASQLELGSGNFIVGFELGLVGADPATMRMEKINAADATVNDTAIISYTATMPDGSKNTGVTKAVVLASADETFGEGFAAAVLGMNAGSSLQDQTYPLGGGSVSFEKIELHYFASGRVVPAVVDAYFPCDYQSADLAGKHVKFDVFLENYTAYTAPAFDDAFVRDTLGVSEDKLNGYTGATLAEKYRSLLRADLEASYQEEYDSLVYAALCDAYANAANYPSDALPSAAIDSAVKYLRVSFDSYINQQIAYYKNYGYELTYDQMVMNLYDLSSESAVENFVTNLLTENAKTTVKRDLAFYAVVREVKAPTAAEFSGLFDEKICDNIQSYMDHYGIKESDYASEAEYEEDYRELYDSLQSTYADNITKEIYWDYAKSSLISLVSVNVTDHR